MDVEVLDLISDSDDEPRPASSVDVDVGAPASTASRNEGKRPVAPPTEAEIIDLEAATGVGLGVSGKPLLPGELEARQFHRRRTWKLTASRSTEDTPEEQHYRFAESAWCRGGGVANQIAAIQYHFNPVRTPPPRHHAPATRATRTLR